MKVLEMTLLFEVEATQITTLKEYLKDQDKSFLQNFINFSSCKTDCKGNQCDFLPKKNAPSSTTLTT